MHMSDALISTAVGGAMYAVSAGIIGYSIKKHKDQLDEKKIPLMGVMGAFIFTAQMINFTIPGTGSSGHIGGGVLLAAILGPVPAAIVLTTVLLIQALFFADGGILALGCNVFNMAVLACLVAYPLIFKPIIKRGFSNGKIMLASIVTVVIGLQLGAFSVVLETLISGKTELPFTTFVVLMQPIHLAIGLVEGIVTGAVLCYVYTIEPKILETSAKGSNLENKGMKKVIITMIVAALLVGGGLSLFASSNPDGLEWSIMNVTGSEELESEGNVYEAMSNIQDKTSIMPDYNFKSNESNIGTSTAGVVGGIVTLAVALLAGKLLNKVKNNKNVELRIKK